MSTFKFTNDVAPNDPWFYQDEWKESFVSRFGWTEWARMQRARSMLEEKNIQNVFKKWYETGNKKYLAIAAKLGVDVDYNVEEQAKA